MFQIRKCQTFDVWNLGCCINAWVATSWFLTLWMYKTCFLSLYCTMYMHLCIRYVAGGHDDWSGVCGHWTTPCEGKVSLASCLLAVAQSCFWPESRATVLLAREPCNVCCKPLQPRFLTCWCAKTCVQMFDCTMGWYCTKFRTFLTHVYTFDKFENWKHLEHILILTLVLLMRVQVA
jgi:hypothetical protein